MLIAKFNDSAGNSEYYCGILFTAASNELVRGVLSVCLHREKERASAVLQHGRL